MLDVLQKGYKRNARVKGLAPGTTIFKPAFRNARTSVLTVIGLAGAVSRVRVRLARIQDCDRPAAGGDIQDQEHRQVGRHRCRGRRRRPGEAALACSSGDRHVLGRARQLGQSRTQELATDSRCRTRRSDDAPALARTSPPGDSERRRPSMGTVNLNIGRAAQAEGAACKGSCRIADTRLLPEVAPDPFMPA